MRKGLIGLAVLALFAPASAQDPATNKQPTLQVPFRVTATKHVVLRARINGKGPYHFIMDTGAPALFVSTAVCKKLGIVEGADGWGTFERFEIEGGVVVPKVKGKVADPFQLDGMNRMGLAGVALHGVIGYNVLARFRIELDFTRDRMAWTPLKFDPGLPEGLNGKAPAGVDALAGLAKTMSLLLGKKGNREARVRGFLGVELADRDGGVFITAVLKDSPAAAAGLLASDRLTHIQDQAVHKTADVYQQTAALPAGTTVRLKVRRDQAKREVTVTLGKGF